MQERLGRALVWVGAVAMVSLLVAATVVRPSASELLQQRQILHTQGPFFFTLVTGTRRSLSLKLSDTRSKMSLGVCLVRDEAGGSWRVP